MRPSLQASAVALVALAAACAPALPPELPEGEPVPAKLDVDAPRGAEIEVDGVFVGVAPLLQPIDAEPGSHRVLVTLDGHEPRVDDVELVRGETTTLEADLDETPQRIASWVVIGAAAAGLGTGIVLGVLGVVEHRASLELAPSADGTSGDQAAYDDTIAARDRYRAGSTAVAGVGLGLFVVGAILYTFDEPDVPAEAKPPEEGSVGFSLQPLVAPDFGGASATVRF